MPLIGPLNLSQKVVDRLAILVELTKQSTGQDLSLVEWLELNAKELAIGQELQAEVAALQQDSEQAAKDTLQVDIAAKHAQLLADLDKP